LQADKLKSMGQLASGITHEINNPLAFINSNMGQLEDYYRSLLQAIEQLNGGKVAQLDPALAREVEHVAADSPEIFAEIKDGLARIGNIVANVRQFARKSAKQRALGDINREIGYSLRLLEKQLSPNTRIELKTGDMPLVNCNISEIGQVLVNLIVNADQALPREGGTITLTSTIEGKCAVITVSDTGKGIPEELIDSIFDPFFTTKPVGEGTGLGLSVSYGIIEAHGGQISVASEIGAGTTFTIVLPLD
jgi:two-component system NtrC family sensor kinase